MLREPLNRDIPAFPEPLICGNSSQTRCARHPNRHGELPAEAVNLVRRIENSTI